MKKKSLALIATAVMLVAVLVVGGTLAYFTDTEDKTNTFTVGNVDIELIESTYHREGNDNSGDVSIPDPTNTASGMKYVTDGHKAFTDAEIKSDAEGYNRYLTARGTNMAPGIAAAKCPYVINKSTTNSAYIRIRVLVPHAANNDFIDVADGGVITNQWCTTSMKSGEFMYDPTSPWTDLEKGWYAPYINKDITYNEKKYDEYVFTRNEPLAPGAMTEWNVWNFIGIDKTANNAEIQKAVTAGAIGANGFDVIVLADAIQADSFANATDAFAAFDAQVNG